MKAVLQISVVLFVTVTFGAARNIRSVSTPQQLQHCININDRATGCPKIDEMEKCLHDIDILANDFSSMTWTASLQYLKRRKSECPGFNFHTTGTCVEHIAEECMNMLRGLQDARDNQVCGEIDGAKTCLNDVKGNCTTNKVGRQLQEVDDLSAECDAGHWVEGPCSPLSIRNCTTDIMFRRTPGNLNEMLFNCNTDRVAEAKECMVDLKTKCTTNYQLQDIGKIWDLVKLVCPTWKED